jgi:HK97 family phage prohead protease
VNKSTFIRTAEFQLRDDGRTLTGRIVPYNEVTTVVEYDEAKGEMVRYQETFLPHSLAAMAQGFNARGGKFSNGQFVPLLIDHNDNFDNMIGSAVELRDEDDGAYASFRLYDDARITKIRSVLSESHTGLSVSFRDTKEPRIINDVVSRVQVFVAHVAATPTPAYPGAMITGMRDAPETIVPIRPHLQSVREWLAEQRGSTVE